MTLVEPSEEKLVERDCGCAIYRGGRTVYCQRHDEYCGAAPASYYRSRYEDDPDALDYEEEEDYVDADDYDVLSEWQTLPERVWSPFMMKRDVDRR